MSFSKVLTGLMVVVSMMSLLMAVAVGVSAAPAVSVAYVDIAKLQAEMPEYQEFMKLIEKQEQDFKVYRNDIFTKHQEELIKLDAECKNEKSGKSEAEQSAIDERYKAIIKEKTEATAKEVDAKRNEIRQALDAEKVKVESAVKQIIQSVADSKKASTVIDKNAVIVGGVDITEDVLKESKKAQSKSK